MNVRDLVKESTFILHGYDQRRGNYLDHRVDYEKFAQLVAKECINILSQEIEQQKNVKTFNEFDRRWVDGKITHLSKIEEKMKLHFGIE